MSEKTDMQVEDWSGVASHEDGSGHAKKEQFRGSPAPFLREHTQSGNVKDSFTY